MCSCTQTPPNPVPHPSSTHSLYLSHGQTAVDDAALVPVPSPSLPPRVLTPSCCVASQMQAECIYSPACGATASEAGITSATIRTGGVTYGFTKAPAAAVAATAEVFLCMAVWQL